MEYNKLIGDMAVGGSVEGYYILKDAFQKTTAAGKPFFSATLSDKSGSIEIKVWDYSGAISGADAGKVVKIRGEVSEYKGTPQITVDRIRLAEAGDAYDVSLLVPVAPIDAQKVFGEIRALVGSMTDSDYKRLCEKMLERHSEAFCKIPAAKSVHHGFLCGLLMHTANMLWLADFLAAQYASVIDRNLLLAGTLLHDFAKEREFVISELGMVSDYSVKGQLLGHLVMGAQEVAALAAELNIPEEKSVLLQHLILSHHGEPDFGAAVKPLCAEAELLSLIDMTDSRMEIYAETLAEVPAGAFSPRVFALDKRIYHHGETTI